MRVCTAKQMAAIDRDTIASGVTGLELMEAQLSSGLHLLTATADGPNLGLQVTIAARQPEPS